MPQMQVKTVQAEQVWKAPDGKMTIHKLVLDYNGQQVQAKTYSNAIATVGWEGTVESYEKEGKQGNETFVKQPQREGFQPGGGSKFSGGGGRSYGSKPQQDSYTMYLSYVKDVAVALINKGEYDESVLNTIVTDVAAAGQAFYAMRPDGESTPPTTKEAEKSELDSLFAGAEQMPSGTEEPWQSPQLPV